MNIEHILKKEGINEIEKLPIIKTNLISNNIASKLCEMFPEHNFDKQNLFVNLSRLNMYTADIPYTSSMAKYVSQNHSIYFNRSMNLEDLDTIAIHECLHYIQESNAKAQNNNRLGIAILGKEGRFVTLRMASGEVRKILGTCKATIGVVGNDEYNLVNLGKAGRSRWLGIRPTVRGSVMNPNDHPHGGGEGKSPVGRPSPMTPWGKKALGVKTRKSKKYSNKLIIRRKNDK